MSLIMMETTVVIPPPPIPANALNRGQIYSKHPLGITNSCRYEFIHISGQAAEETPKTEYSIAEEKCRLSAKNIAHFAVERLERRQSDEISRN